GSRPRVPLRVALIVHERLPLGNHRYRPQEGTMAEYQTAIIVDAPLEEVYNQWTQFEEFPRFMEGVLAVRQVDDKRLLWRARIGGVEKQWEAEITDQTPNRRIAWKSISGATNAGAVLFESVPEGTHVTLKLVYDPEGASENVGDALGFV